MMTERIPNVPGIYCIRHISTNRRYVGSACRLMTRQSDHFSALKRGKHHSGRMQRAWDKYGHEAFLFEVLEYVENRSELIIREQHWIDFYQASVPSDGFNICAKAGSSLGKRHSEESKAKMSEARVGRKASLETREKMRVARIGKRASPETILAFSMSRKGKKHTPEAIAKLRAAKLGKKNSREAVEKTAAANRGRINTPDAIARMKAAQRIRSSEERTILAERNKARVWSAEARAKISNKAKGRVITPETRAKTSATLLRVGQSDKQKNMWNDPAYRASHSEGQRRRRERERAESSRA